MPKWPPSSRALSISTSSAESRSPGVVSRVLTAGIRAYRLTLRAAFPVACRFHPSCSEFAREALNRHGALRGTGLALARLARCHPWHPGGYDPVPELER